MAVTQSWKGPDTIATALTTELNSLANAAQSAASSAIDNEGGLFQYLEVELVLASLTPTGTPYCLLYLVKSIDGGTNYEDLTTSASHLVIASFPMSTAAAAKRIVVANILIPPVFFKLALQNQAGPALGASGNTVRFKRYNELST